MPSLTLKSKTDVLDLDSVAKFGYGVQALAGATGLGLPARAGNWVEGAGDGAVFRGARTLRRDMDIPLLIQGRTRDEYRTLMSRLSKMLAQPCTMIWDDGDRKWSLDVVWIGGGDYAYGSDTNGGNDGQMIVTLAAGDPYWKSTDADTVLVGSNDAPTGLLTGSLATFKLASSQVLGSMVLDNAGDAPAYPIWRVDGPGNNFKATSPKGEVLWWTGTLTSGQWIQIDTQKGIVIDQSGANRYDKLASAPRMWSIPPGQNTATVELLGTTAGQSKVTCSWRTKVWAVI